MRDMQMLKLYCVRARMEAPNIASRCSQSLGMRRMRARPGCAIRCSGLVAATLLPGSHLRAADASTMASAITCMERAFVMRTREHKYALVGDALLGRVFSQMGTLDTGCIELLAIAATNLVREAESLDAPTMSMIEQGAASRDAWTGALALCGVGRSGAFAAALADQRRPCVATVEELAGAASRDTRDAIMALMKQ